MASTFSGPRHWRDTIQMPNTRDIIEIARLVVGPDDKWAMRGGMQAWSKLEGPVKAQLADLRYFLFYKVRLGPGVSLNQVFPFESIIESVRDAIKTPD